MVLISDSCLHGKAHAWLGDLQEWNKHGRYELLGCLVGQGRKSEDMTGSWFDSMDAD